MIYNVLRKTVFTLLIVTASLLLLVGCGNGAPESGTTPQTPEVTAAPATPTPTPTATPMQGGNTDTTQPDETDPQAGDDDVFFFVVGGVEIRMGQPALPIIEELGDPLHYHEAISCAFEGLDKSWHYSGFVVHAYPLDGDDFILSVILVDDTHVTERRVYLGMSYEDMVSAYGSDYERNHDQFLYRRGGTSLAFIIPDDYIGQITYRYEDAPEM
jgi:uncharacterized lipoprotein NlpE involved in copper resistance